MHRLVSELFELIDESGMSLPEFCKYHGLNENTVRTWRRKSNPVSPQVRVLDNVLQRMGFRLMIERK